jgi:hypothetical protein
MHGASAAQRDAAAELRSGEPNNIAQNPQQRHVTGNSEVVFLIVDRQRRHSCPGTHLVVPPILQFAFAQASQSTQSKGCTE